MAAASLPLSVEMKLAGRKIGLDDAFVAKMPTDALFLSLPKQIINQHQGGAE